MPQPTRPMPADEPTDEPRAKTILICEDEEPLRELIRAVLGPGFRYLEAVDGPEALEHLRTGEPDLVILDLMLPQTSGFEILDAIRAGSTLRTTPVVVVTAWSHVEAAAREAGADQFISKPFEPEELEAAVRRLLDP